MRTPVSIDKNMNLVDFNGNIITLIRSMPPEERHALVTRLNLVDDLVRAVDTLSYHLATGTAMPDINVTDINNTMEVWKNLKK